MADTVHVISPITGAGNRLDLELAAPLLKENGFQVTCYGVQGRGKLTRSGQLARTLIHSPHRFKANIFMGPIFPEWLPIGVRNAWIPNPEGVAPHVQKWLPKIDLVLAKTRLTERIFRDDLGHATEYIGFTSRDQFDPDIKRDRRKFFHACSSPYKGTRRLLETWRAHPEWPELVAVISNGDEVALAMTAPNIRLIAEVMPDDEFQKLQNSIATHICCSEAEGFGHSIYEALSCGALVMTTDGPPMNEFTKSAPGLLLDHEDETPEVGLSHRYYFTARSLEEKIARVLKFTDVEWHNIETQSRAFFLENDRAFRRRFPEVIRALIA